LESVEAAQQKTALKATVRPAVVAFLVEPRNEDVSKTKKIVNMLADDPAAPAAARTLAKAAEQEGKLISDYLMERLQPDHPLPVTAWDKMKTATAAARETVGFAETAHRCAGQTDRRDRRL
jgi:hypothetical protein